MPGRNGRLWGEDIILPSCIRYDLEPDMMYPSLELPKVSGDKATEKMGYAQGPTASQMCD